MDVVPNWMKELTDRVLSGLRTLDETAPPIDCHVYFDPFFEQWEVTLFLECIEVVGGPRDGALAPTPFSLDLTEVTEPFDVVHHFHWQAQHAGDGDDLGPHVAIEGVYRGHNIWLRILAAPPGDFTPAPPPSLHSDEIT